MRRILLLSIFGLTIAACSPVVAPPDAGKAAPGQAYDDLLILMRERLDVMHDVARYKWAKKAPIEDIGRETASLQSVADRGKGMGLAPEITRAFFEAQIEAAKLVQRADFRRWKADRRGPTGKPPDLAHALRPRIDALNRDLLATLAKHQAQLRDGNAPAEIRSRAELVLTGEGINSEVRAAAIRPLIGTGKSGRTHDQVDRVP